MANSVHNDKQGPDWPLGYINVVTPGTPISIMSLVDPTSLNDPATATPGSPGTDEYTVRAQQIMFQGFKPDVNGMQMNTGNVYLVRKAQGTGTGNRNDYGDIVLVIPPGATVFLASAPLNRNVYNPYRYRLDADVASEGALVTLIIQ